jgi:hypothetical protein
MELIMSGRGIYSVLKRDRRSSLGNFWGMRRGIIFLSFFTPKIKR